MTDEKYAFIERLTRWLMPEQRDPDLAADARRSTTLDGVYSGKSAKIHRLVALAYLRGIRRGASCAWEAKQPVTLRDVGPGGHRGIPKWLTPGARVVTSYDNRGAVVDVFVKISYDGDDDPGMAAYLRIANVAPEPTQTLHSAGYGAGYSAFVQGHCEPPDVSMGAEYLADWNAGMADALAHSQEA